MAAEAVRLHEQVIDIAEEIREQPDLSFLSLADYQNSQDERSILTVWARDIAGQSTQSRPRILIQGQAGDIVQLSDYATQGISIWSHAQTYNEPKGFHKFICEYDGVPIELLIQNTLDVYDAEGDLM